MSTRSKGRLSVPLVVAASVSLLVCAISAGLRLPGFGLMLPFPKADRLDYSAAPPGGFAPLDSSLVSQLIGGLAGGSVTAAGSRGGSRQTWVPPLPRPVEVEHPFTNDHFENAYTIPSVPFTARTTTSAATREPGEPESCSAIGGSAWYAFKTPQSVPLLAATSGSNYATALTVYEGRGLRDLARIGECSSDPRGNALVAFTAKAGTTYYFQVDGPIGGVLIFTLEHQGVTTMASQATNGSQGNGTNWFPVISRDGSRVLFTSTSSNLAENRVLCRPALPTMDTCDDGPLFVRDRTMHRTGKLYDPPSPAGVVGMGFFAFAGSMSADARYISLWTVWNFTAPNVGSSSPLTPVRSEIVRLDTLTGVNDRVSVPCPTCAGNETDGSSVRTQITADGRFVVFGSEATNLIPDDTNGVRDVFMRDMSRGVTVRVSVPDGCHATIPGCQGNGDASTQSLEKGSDLISISRDGRYIVFKSAASNLVTGDRNGVVDVFVRDLLVGTTERVNLSPTGEEANGDTRSLTTKGIISITNDGRYVFFLSRATNLVPDTRAEENVFRRDRLLKKTELVTRSSRGEPANRAVATDPVHDPFHTYLDISAEFLFSEPNISPMAYSATPDGRYVAFSSTADNLVPGDENGFRDVFLRDLETGITSRVSVSSLGEESVEGSCNSPTMSDDARFIAFHCLASNLVENDSNENFDVFVRELPHARALSGWY